MNGNFTQRLREDELLTANGQIAISYSSISRATTSLSTPTRHPSKMTSPPSTPLFHDIHLPLPSSSSSTFSLQSAVCSHGLFMLAPNRWDPHTHSLLRPLRLSSCPSSSSLLTRISELTIPHALLVRVYGTSRLEEAEEGEVVGQVRRMLRMEEMEERKVREFREMHAGAKESGFGRVFRSPSLFEDMVKCILFCNCQWPRTLSMAQALCDLQLELRCQSSKSSLNAADSVKAKVDGDQPATVAPSTPAIKEYQRKRKRQKTAEVVGQIANDVESHVDLGERERSSQQNATQPASSKQENVDVPMLDYPCLDEDSKLYYDNLMGDFPSPKEIAGLDEKYLAKRCGLGYRAGRILKLAQAVEEGRIELGKLEELSSEASLANCNKVDEVLKEIDGFGRFTRSNVLMCMGFYNVVPTDSETIRHLKQVHGIVTNVSTVQGAVEKLYGHYEPYQFLAYWSEIWSFYEDWFGKLSEMPSSDYGLITASNMKTKRKRIK